MRQVAVVSALEGVLSRKGRKVLSKATRDHLEENINRGIVWFRTHGVADWTQEFDPEVFVFKSTHCCVIGQVLGWGTARDAFYADGAEDSGTEFSAHGFDVAFDAPEDDDEQYEYLQEAWLRRYEQHDI